VAPFSNQVKQATNRSNADRAQALFMSKLQPQDQQIMKSGHFGEKISRDNIGAIEHELGGTEFKKFVNEGYAAEDGYSIRINPNTGQKEMFIAGTRNAAQWGLNALDSVLYGADKVISAGVNATERAFMKEIFHKDVAPVPVNLKLFSRLDRPRENKTKFYEQIAKDEGVEVIYGHSRGGAMVADMNVPGVEKVGLDAAMLIARNTDELNINEGGGYNPLGAFDALIGLTGQDNVHYDASGWSPHKVWNVNDP